MKTTIQLFLSCFFFLVMPLLSDGATLEQPPQEPVFPAGERMVLTINDVEYTFRWCPPGTFTMGSPTSEEWRSTNERQHRVTCLKVSGCLKR